MYFYLFFFILNVYLFFISVETLLDISTSKMFNGYKKITQKSF